MPGSARRPGVLWLGLFSGLLYILVYVTQRAIFHNGLVLEVRGIMLRVEPTDYRRLVWEATGYYAATVALYACYIRLLHDCRQGAFDDRRGRLLVLLVPVLFNVGFLLGRPYLSIDIFSYMAHGYLGTLPGTHPYLNAARDVQGTVLGFRITAWGWHAVHGITPYGPVWTLFEVGVMRATRDVSTALLVIKSVVVGASLLSAVLIWRILGYVRPRDQLLGTLIYLWNPMIIVEFAGEGHNDALMIVFVLLAILFTIRTGVATGIIALVLGALTKYVPLILLPAQLVYGWRTRRSWYTFALQVAVGAGGGLVVAALLYRPLWVGAATFNGVIGAGRPSFLASTSGALYWSLQRMIPEPAAAALTSLILDGSFGVYLLIVSLRVRDRADLLKACGGIALFYVLIASPGYWAWYATLPLALMALWPYGPRYWVLMSLTYCSRLVAPLDDMTANGLGSWSIEVWTTTVIAILLPMLVFVVLTTRQKRMQGTHDSDTASSLATG